MTIAEPSIGDKGKGGGVAAKIRGISGQIPKDILAIVAILLASGAGFGLGMLVDREQAGKPDPKDTQLWIENLPAVERPANPSDAAPVSTTAKPVTKAVAGTQAAAAAAALPTTTGSVVASKTGSAYYLPSCSGAARIKPENLVTFASAVEAQAKGYSPAKTCKGL
jgi:hypothetical protein